MLTCYFEDGGKAFLRHLTVAVIIVQDNKLLMIKRSPHFSEPNKYGLPGGYVDRDETAVDAALREVREETGYEAHSVQLFQIIDRPDRPNEEKQNVEFCFLAEIGKKVGEHDHEITEVKWFPLNQLPSAKTIAFDHFASIELYRKYVQEKFPLPRYDSQK